MPKLWEVWSRSRWGHHLSGKFEKISDAEKFAKSECGEFGRITNVDYANRVIDLDKYPHN